MTLCSNGVSFQSIHLLKKADLSGTHEYLLDIKDLLPSTFKDMRRRKENF